MAAQTGSVTATGWRTSCSPGSGGGVSLQDRRDDYADGWQIDEVRSFRGELNLAFLAEFPNQFPPAGLLMRFAVILRTA